MQRAQVACTAVANTSEHAIIYVDCIRGEHSMIYHMPKDCIEILKLDIEALDGEQESPSNLSDVFQDHCNILDARVCHI